MKLRHIMSRDVLTLASLQPASDALALMRDAGVRHAIVTTGGAVEGVVTERDLGGPHGGVLRKGHTVRDFMRPSVRSAEPDMKLDDAALLMRREHIGCLPILDRGELVGIVTRGDLLEALATGRKRSREPIARHGEPVRPPRVSSPNRDKWP